MAMHGARFEGKTVLITGAASGIGRAAAVRLSAEGARLILADRDTEGLVTVARQIGKGQGRPHVIGYDASDNGSTAAMAAEAATAFGRLDCVVCNAGIYRRAHFADIGAAEWEIVLQVNLTSNMRIAQVVTPALRETGGNLIAIASTAGLDGIAYAAHYAAAKAGLIALIKSLAVEFAPDGVRFNAICPGRVKTGISKGLEPLPNQNEALLVRQPRLAGHTEGGQPEEIAAAIAYLGSQDASYLSGSILVIDGTQTIG